MLIETMFFLFLGNPARAEKCSEKAASQAETAFSSVKEDWNQLFEYYDKHGKSCPDVASEGLSELEEKLFTKHWDHLDELNNLIKKDAKFKAFVLAHIDSTMGHPGAIEKLAKNKCPRDLGSLCKQIAATAAEATKQND